MNVSERTERLQQRSFFDELLALRDEQRRNRDDAEILVKGDELPWELNRQGYMKWYMAPTMDDIVMSVYMMYLQRIPPGSRSGRQLVQGGQICFAWRGGAGYTVIDGERYDWNHWDVIQIPIRTKGSVVQHFNDSDSDIEIMCCSINDVHAVGADKGAGFEQLDDCPEYREKQRTSQAVGAERG
ncbi:MAG: hypothetical protein GEU68_14955 [Actinobacteria bacterium]|nr:hypothetical protein [Actinomycetota bacterium]